MTQDLHGLELANKIYAANVSPRSRTLALFESEVEGTRFDGRPDWYSDVPIFERKPCIIYQAVESSIQSKIDLLLGDGRFPTITSNPDEDEDDDSDEDGLPEEQSKSVDKLILSFVREAKLGRLWREMYEGGQACGTSIALLGSRKGKLFAETLPAKWATVKRDANQEPIEVTVEYPYIRTQNIKGVWAASCWLYRRVIDATNDTTFAPAEARLDGISPKWTVQSVTPHNLGFAPVIWYKHRAPLQNIDGDDGNAVHRTILDELEGIDLALSQRHTGALSSLPQIVEVGVDPGYNPTAEGSSEATVQVTMSGGVPSSSNPVRGQYVTRSSRGNRGARKKGPGFPWQYESPDTKVTAINTPGEALDSIDKHIKDLRSKICETLAWVPLDPDSIKFAATVSGKALEILRERELNRVSRDREVFGEDVILGTIDMLFRIALKLGASLRTPRLKKCLSILAKFQGPDGWMPPLLTLQWPSYFMPSPEDDDKIVTSADKAYKGGMITRRTQVKAIARIYGIENVDAYCEGLEKEAAERAEHEAEELAAGISKMHAGLNDPNARGRGADPKAALGSGSSSAAAAPKKTPQGRAE